MKKLLDNKEEIIPASIANLPQVFRSNIITFCSNNKLEPEEIDKIWYRPDPLDEREGWIGILRTVKNKFFEVAVVPSLSFEMIGRKLNLGEFKQLHLAAGSFPVVPGYSIDEFGTYLHIWMPMKPAKEEEIVKALDACHEDIVNYRNGLLKISNELFDLDLRKKYSYPEPKLPVIKLLPSDMKIIETILSYCDGHTQEIFHLLMKHWDILGFQVETTPSMISLEAPYGKKSVRILYLMAGGYKKAPVIGLNWEGLKRFPAIPEEVISLYQKAVKRLTLLRETETAAYIAITGQFTLDKTRQLLREVKNLVKGIKSVEGEKVPVSEHRTANGIAATLEQCDPVDQEIFKSLMKTWQKVGGVIHCQRPGRIYLRLKTRKHESGRFSLDSHLFNFLILASPKGKTPARVEFAWGLATNTYASYLDCIPVEVEKYESVISELKGFTQKGTIRYIPASNLKNNKLFTDLTGEIIKIKKAEENTK